VIQASKAFLRLLNGRWVGKSLEGGTHMSKRTPMLILVIKSREIKGYMYCGGGEV